MPAHLVKRSIALGYTAWVAERRHCQNGNVETIYDLQGRKVANPTKGIYIINGKKVLIK